MFDDETADEYRRWIIQAEHTATRDFDRAVMTLGGGALVLSVTFLRGAAPDVLRLSKTCQGNPQSKVPRKSLDALLTHMD